MHHEVGTVRANLACLAGDAQRPKGGEEPQMNTDGKEVGMRDEPCAMRRGQCVRILPV